MGDVGDGDGGTKKGKAAASGRRKPAYAGGLVLEPKKGFLIIQISRMRISRSLSMALRSGPKGNNG